MSKRVIPFAVVAALIITGILVVGCGRRHFFCAKPEERAAMIVKKITSDLDLTKEQVEKVSKIKDEILARTKDLRDEREAVRKEMMDLVKSDKLDKNKLTNFINMREEKIRALKPFFIDKMVEFHILLTPEQRIKLAEKLEKFHNWCGKK
jgi:Spy/CpxP family protein refolding chaperone